MQTSTLGGQEQQVPVYIFPDATALGEVLAQDILEGASRAEHEGRRYLLGCPSGRSAVPVYQALGRYAAARQALLAHLVIVMMDEYVVRTDEGFRYSPVEAHYSCRRFAEEAIRGIINQGLAPACRVPAGNVWTPDPEDPAACDARLQAAGGVDLFIIATGAGDGHVAFNPPGSPADAPARIIQLAESTRRDNLATFPEFAGLHAVPEYGVSVGLGTLAALSHAVVLIAHGPGKREALGRLAQYADFDPSWPASIIFRCRRARAMFDTAAAQDLPLRKVPLDGVKTLQATGE